jgi:hypothetical protein
MVSMTNVNHPGGYAVAIAGEAWEAAFAAATALNAARWVAPDVELWIPEEFMRAIGTISRKIHVVPALSPGFQDYQDIRARMLAAGGPLLLLAAGAMASRPQPLDRLGGPFSEPRCVEWFADGAGPTVLHFDPPQHRPPTVPQHRSRREGALMVWELDTGTGYYDGLLPLNPWDCPPVFQNYGPAAPVFLFNTNRFDEPPVGGHQQYAILASGLLGLRLVLESSPPPGARIIVYDINPHQLDWFKFLLKHARTGPEMDDARIQFMALHPNVAVRPVQLHEAANAATQAAWYRENHLRIGRAARELEWEFVVCDLMTEPGSVLDRLEPSRTTMFMYLDVFLIWHTNAGAPWVEDHAGIARSLEQLVRGRVNEFVTFVPGDASCRFQLSPESPFARSV